MNIVILAAGMGKRMRSVLPKVLHPLAGLPLLGHVLDCALALNPARVCVVYGHGGAAVPDWVKTHYDGERVELVEQAQQLGTGHAVLQAASQLDVSAPTLMLYGDVPLIAQETLNSLRASAGADRLALLTVNLNDPHGYGRILRDAQGRVTGIVEEKDASAAQRAMTEVNTGILIAPTGALKRWLENLKNDNAQGEYYLTDIVAAAVADGVAVTSGAPVHAWEVQGINNRAQLAELERCFQLEQARRLMEGGVTLADPARIEVRGNLQCASDVTIDVGCVFEGAVTIASGAVIEAHCVIRDTSIAQGARIRAFSHLEGASVGEDALIGPYARLRPGAVLAENTHVGNFVEIKNASLGSGSKANHLSYLGDATVGARVNVGAGTITCNYDGINKFRTVIEDDAFIGSDVQLIAPVTVGAGATLGAGTTLVKDAPAGQLTLSRVRQVSVPTCKRPAKK